MSEQTSLFGEPEIVDEREYETCDKHHCDKVSVTCWNCDDGYSHHDCGEDCCCCLDPEPNVRCDICRGKGLLVLCPTCAPEACEDAY